MSKPKRYEAMGPEVIETPTGEFVRWQDYARLKAEVERLTKAIEGSSYYFMSIKLNVENAQLRKAIADASDKLKLLADWAVVCEVESGQINQVQDILRIDAKEGKPSV